MRFCDDHWQALREAIIERGLGALIAPNPEVAVEQAVDQLRRGEGAPEPGGTEIVTPANFDPLMGAMWAITSNSLRMLGPSGLYVMAGDDVPEDPIELEQISPGPRRRFEAREGRPTTWPRCPICYLGVAHEITCNGKRCSLPTVDGYAWMIGKAADEQVEKAAELGVQFREDTGGT